MKSFNIGAKVEVLHSAGDNAAEWTPATVVNAVDVQPGFKAHGCQGGNVVKIDGVAGTRSYVFVTEQGMIRPA